MNERLQAVQRMQDYIAVHLEEEITMADLAKAALFSPWYAYRLFRAHTGLSVSDYIRRLRLSQSAMRLKKNGGRIIDVALHMGFGSADSYTRAFRREFGCNPCEYARHPRPIALFVPYGVKFREIGRETIDMENIQSVFVQLIRKPERKVMIKRGVNADNYFDYCAEVGCDVWGLLMSMDSMCGEPVCLWLPDAFRKPGTSVYVQGVEIPVDYSGDIPEGFDVITLPDAEYLQFQGEPFQEEDYAKAIECVWHAMGKYDPALIGYAWDESNPRIQLEPKGERGYIELKAVRKR